MGRASLMWPPSLGDTTGAVVEAGNIREDMFNRLITADLVIADVSLHNPNVFYELGLRQAFRDKFTFVIRCDLDAYPFDLQTDRYFDYQLLELLRSPDQVAERLTTALRKTLNQYRADSPVFRLMPQLEAEDRSELADQRGFFHTQLQDLRFELARFKFHLRGICQRDLAGGCAAAGEIGKLSAILDLPLPERLLFAIGKDADRLKLGIAGSSPGDVLDFRFRRGQLCTRDGALQPERPTDCWSSVKSMPFKVTLLVPGPALALLSQRIAENQVAEKAGGSADSASCWR